MANSMKITFEGEIVRRWKEQTKTTGKEIVYIAVKVPRGEWSDTFRIKAKDAETVKPYEIGAKVVASAFVGGREWTNPSTNKIAYFTDLNLASIARSEPVKQPDTQSEPNEVDDLDEMPF